MNAFDIEHVTDDTPCWCDPEYIPNGDGTFVVVHRENGRPLSLTEFMAMKGPVVDNV